MGIEKTKLKNGEVAIYVTFKYLNKRYPKKNFTKLFNCRTIKQAETRLEEIKSDIRDNKNPFNPQGETLNDIFYRRLEKMVKDKIWKKNTTAKGYKIFYEAHIKEPIGHKKLNRITYSNLDDILDSLSGKSTSLKKKVSFILNPIFEKARKRGEVTDNPCIDLPTFETKKMEQIKYRSSENNLLIVKKLIKASYEYKAQYIHLRKETNYFFIFLIFTSHRYGEILQLKKENLRMNENKVIAPLSITKTKEYHYPFPIECKEYFESIENDTDLLFPNLTYECIYMMFQRLVRNAEIDLYLGKKLTAHDTRRLMLNIMISDLKIDALLADDCLEHAQTEVISHYLDFSYEDKEEAYFKYWELIRN